MKKLISGLLAICLLSLTACSNISAINLMSDVTKDDIAAIVIDDPEEQESNKTDEIMDFSFEILEKSFDEENILISPLSIITALAMTANGADGNTISQMENVFGTDIESLNEFLYSYMSYLPSEEKYTVNTANSIWIKNDIIDMNTDFLQIGKNYYDASIYEDDFDNSTLKNINNWVKNETDGQIDKVIEEISPDTFMYLINAVSFDAEWDNIYDKSDIKDGEFTTENGDVQKVEFMYSSEYNYIELGNATGFSKDYADGKYSFVALLPDEDLSMAEFTESLTAQDVLYALENSSNEKVLTSIPKFEFDYSTELKDVLSDMGMSDAFIDIKADFSQMGETEFDNIYIEEVIHKTTITVDEKGTKAGAVTVISMGATSADASSEPKKVYLDRPFYFMIIDNEFNLPIFMGTLMEV
ncbi:MAG: serpin family protein [Clostridia bacterium]